MYWCVAVACVLAAASRGRGNERQMVQKRHASADRNGKPKRAQACRSSLQSIRSMRYTTIHSKLRKTRKEAGVARKARRDDRGECEEETNKKWKESEDEVGRREEEENMNEE